MSGEACVLCIEYEGHANWASSHLANKIFRARLFVHMIHPEASFLSSLMSINGHDELNMQEIQEYTTRLS